jgi:putative tryptophan/tyrosine transport system substrate-binding protein
VIDRRTFLAGTGAVLLATPLAARAQQGDRVRRVGVLMGGLSAGDPGGQAEAAALKLGLQELGWVEGRNLQITDRWPGGEPDRIQASAKELVELRCEVIVARSTPGVAALLKEKHTIPIVFTVVVDPVGSGFVASLARPGGNVTGFQNYEFTMVGKWLQLLKEIAPHVRRVAYLYNPTTLPAGFLRSLKTVAPSISMQLVEAPMHDSSEIDAAVAAFAHKPGGGLMMMPDVFTLANRVQIVGLAAKHGLPAVYPSRLWPTISGLISYGPDTPDLFRRLDTGARSRHRRSGHPGGTLSAAAEGFAVGKRRPTMTEPTLDTPTQHLDWLTGWGSWRPFHPGDYGRRIHADGTDEWWVRASNGAWMALSHQRVEENDDGTITLLYVK